MVKITERKGEAPLKYDLSRDMQADSFLRMSDKANSFL